MNIRERAKKLKSNQFALSRTASSIDPQRKEAEKAEDSKFNNASIFQENAFEHRKQGPSEIKHHRYMSNLELKSQTEVSTIPRLRAANELPRERQSMSISMKASNLQSSFGVPSATTNSTLKRPQQWTILQNRQSSLNSLKNQPQPQNNSSHICQTVHNKWQSYDQNIIDVSLTESLKDSHDEVIDIDFKNHQPPQENVKAMTDKLFQKFENISNRGQRSLVGGKSNSKLKLRDYIYMVQTTVKHSLGKRESSKSLIKRDSNSPEASLKAKPNESNVSMNSLSKQSSLCRRSEPIQSKYSMPSVDMLKIVKKEVREDIENMIQNLQMIKEGLCDNQTQQNEEGSNTQLLSLYNVRRQIKDQISKRIENTLQTIVSSQKNQRNSSLVLTSHFFTRSSSINL